MKKINVTLDKRGNEFFQISFPYDQILVDNIRKIPSRKFDKKTKSWLVRADHQTAPYVEVFFKYFKFETITQEALDIIERFKKPVTENDEMPKLKVELRPFQRFGVSSAIRFERCIIADEMGLGKSAESIASVEKLSAYPCLIVCPASVKLNWKKEIKMWVTRKSLVISGEKPFDKYKADFVIINYDILEKHQEELEKVGFKSIIFDESHMVKNYRAKRTKALKKLAKGIKYRFALTGTPLLNRPKELMPQLDALDRLESFGGFWTFAKKYCGAVETQYGWSFGDATNLEELHENLTKFCMIRRLKSEVLKDLPPKQRTYVPIEIDNRDEYELAVKDFVKWIKNKLINIKDYTEEVNKLENLTEYQKKLLIEAKISSKVNRTLAAEALVKIEYLKQITVRGKIIKLKEFIDNALDQDIKLIVFATHKEIQNMLWKEYKGKNAARIFAEDDIDERQKNIDKFQKSKKCPIMIASLKAGGVGINLTESSTVVFCEFGWTPAEHEQAEDRCHRIGQTDSVNCYYLYGENTIDDTILELIEKKRGIANAAIDGKVVEEKSNDIEDIINKFI